MLRMKAEPLFTDPSLISISKALTGKNTALQPTSLTLGQGKGLDWITSTKTEQIRSYLILSIERPWGLTKDLLDSLLSIMRERSLFGSRLFRSRYCRYRTTSQSGPRKFAIN